MSFQILQRAYAPYDTAAQFPASGDSRLIYRATDTGYLYTWDASESAYKLAGIDPTASLEWTGNAATATTLATARTLTIGSTGKTFNGSANVAWTLAEMGAAQKPSKGTWTPVLTADTPPTGVVLQQAYADFFILEGCCWFTFGFQVSNPGTGGAGRIKIAGMPVTATSAYTAFARPQFAVNQNGTIQLYQLPPGVNYIYSTVAVPQYQTLTAGVYIQGQGFFKIA